ncbi:hypothetical protein H6503_02290 [Candidatus Woesearchaeota archaeon]|nr:hypothetical protein [Candidatus Woesearchaeota archaeon]
MTNSLLPGTPKRSTLGDILLRHTDAINRDTVEKLASDNSVMLIEFPNTVTENDLLRYAKVLNAHNFYNVHFIESSQNREGENQHYILFFREAIRPDLSMDASAILRNYPGLRR